MVKDKFSDVVNKNVTPLVPTYHPHGPDQWAKRLSIVPVKDSRQLSLSFPMPDMTHLYESQPCRYVAHLFGHEGPGSLCSLLKEYGWITYLSAGCRSGE